MKKVGLKESVIKKLEDKLDNKSLINSKYDLETCIKNHIEEMYTTSILHNVESNFIDWDTEKYFQLKFIININDYNYNKISTGMIKKWIKEDFDIDPSKLEVSIFKQGKYSGGNVEYDIKYYI